MQICGDFMMSALHDWLKDWHEAKLYTPFITFTDRLSNEDTTYPVYNN